MQQFMQILGSEAVPQSADAETPAHFPEMMHRMEHNMTFWMEHELLVYPRLSPNMAALRAHADQLVLAGGAHSREQDLPPPRPIPCSQTG